MCQGKITAGLFNVAVLFERDFCKPLFLLKCRVYLHAVIAQLPRVPMNEGWIHLTDYGIQNCIILARFKQHWTTILILFPTNVYILMDLGTQNPAAVASWNVPYKLSSRCLKISKAVHIEFVPL